MKIVLRISPAPRRGGGPVARAGGGRPGPGGWSPGTVADPEEADGTALQRLLASAGPLERRCLPSSLLGAPSSRRRRSSGKQRRGPALAGRLRRRPACM